MSKYVYYYSAAKGIGEAPRLLMAYGGQDFEDNRLTMNQWPHLKPSKLYKLFQEPVDGFPDC